MKVYIVYGTEDYEQFPDYYIIGVYSDYKKAEKAMVDCAFRAFELDDTASHNRYCEYKDGILSEIYDGLYWHIYLKMEVGEVQ